MHLRDSDRRHSRQRALECVVVLRRKADDHIRGEVELLERLEPRPVLADRVATAHRPEDVVVARLQRNVKVVRHDRRRAQRVDQFRGDVVDLDRREAKALEAFDRAYLPDQPGQREPCFTIAEAAEVDAGEHDLAVALCDATADLSQDCVRRAAARPAADERDDTEGAREGAAVLDLDEGTDAVETVLGLHAADRADVACDGGGDVLALPDDDPNVGR